jgi:hypothetical protein
MNRSRPLAPLTLGADPDHAPDGPTPFGIEDPNVGAILQALLATGMKGWPAIGVVADRFGLEPVRAPWNRILDAVARQELNGWAAVAVLDEIATEAPAIANALLAESLLARMATWDHDGADGYHLQGRAWITDLPEGLGPLPWLNLRACLNLTRLPAGLTVRGQLNLTDCAALEALPPGLFVQECIWLNGCAGWDGIIPPDVQIRGRLYTDLNASDEGEYLEEWRKANPGREGLAGPLAEVSLTVLALRASGATLEASLGLAAAGHGPEAVLPLLVRDLPDRRTQDAVNFLRRVGEAHGELAQRGLSVWLANRGRRNIYPLDLADAPWVTSIPDGFAAGARVDLRRTGLVALPAGIQIDGDLLLDQTPLRSVGPGCQVDRSLSLRGTALQTLPDGLWVMGGLILQDTPIQTLPQGLFVGNDLDLRDCPAWDGTIPTDAQIGRIMRTPRHPEGILLAAWRAQHPHGEAAP